MASIDDANRPNDQNTYRTAMVNGNVRYQRIHRQGWPCGSSHQLTNAIGNAKEQEESSPASTTRILSTHSPWHPSNCKFKRKRNISTSIKTENAGSSTTTTSERGLAHHNSKRIHKPHHNLFWSFLKKFSASYPISALKLR